MFIAREDTVIEPGEQKVIGIIFKEEDLEGLSCRTGIVTPVRDFSAITNKFGVAYAYGENMDRLWR